LGLSAEATYDSGRLAPRTRRRLWIVQLSKKGFYWGNNKERKFDPVFRAAFRTVSTVLGSVAERM